MSEAWGIILIVILVFILTLPFLIFCSRTDEKSILMGDPNNISVEQLKLALSRWRAPQNEISACINKQDLVTLYKTHKQLSEARAAHAAKQKASASQSNPSNPSYNSSSYTSPPGVTSKLPNLGWQNMIFGSLVLLFVLQYFGIVGDGMPGGGSGGGKYSKRRRSNVAVIVRVILILLSSLKS